MPTNMSPPHLHILHPSAERPEYGDILRVPEVRRQAPKLMRTETTLCLCLTWNSTTTPSTTSSMTALTTPNQGQRVSLCTHTSFMYFRHISVHTACGYCVNDALHPACSRYNFTHITCYYIGVYVHVRMCPAPAGSRPPRISKVMLKI